MRTLILLRHGEAERRAASGRDVDRALTSAGLAAAAAAGEGLARQGLRPDLALVSAARRAQSTWETARGAWAPDVPPCAVRPDLYEAAAADLLAAAEGEGADMVLVVAHNPGLHELAARLAGADPLAARGFAPATAAAFARGPEGWRPLAWRTPASEPTR